MWFGRSWNMRSRGGIRLENGDEKAILQRRISEWIQQVQADSGGISLRELARRAGVPPATITTAARGESGVAILVVLSRLARVWPNGDYNDANAFLFGNEPTKTTRIPVAARRELGGDAEIALNAAFDQLRSVVGALDALMDRIVEVSSVLSGVADELNYGNKAAMAAAEENLVALAMENKALKLQLGLRVETQRIEASEESIQDRLNGLKARKKGQKGIASATAVVDNLPTAAE